jgi:hypothetical protein
MFKPSVVAVLIAVTASPVLGQAPPKVELGANIGYSLNSGFDLGFIVNDPLTNIAYDRVTFKDALAYGASLGFFLRPGYEIEAEWGRTESTLQGESLAGNKDDFMGMNMDHIHGNFIYHYGYPEAKARPFFGIGLGVTIFSAEDFRGGSGESETYFSGTLLAGVKVRAGQKVALRLQARWTPTYITSSPGGVWCGWGACWTIADAHYTNSFGFTAGLSYLIGGGS